MMAYEQRTTAHDDHTIFQQKNSENELAKNTRSKWSNTEEEQGKRDQKLEEIM